MVRPWVQMVDPDIHNIERSCPTLQLTTIHVAMQILASLGHAATVGDATLAFMQGDPSKRAEPLYAELPGTDLDNLDLEAGSLIRLDREVYGLVSGMSNWRATVVDRLLSLGYRTSVYDPCLFTLHTPGRLMTEGLLALEVDDTFSGGGKEHERRMNELRKMINFGCWHNLRSDGPHDFAGRRFVQNPDFGFRIDMKRYIDKVVPHRDQCGEEVPEDGAVHRFREQAVTCRERSARLGRPAEQTG